MRLYPDCNRHHCWFMYSFECPSGGEFPEVCVCVSVNWHLITDAADRALSVLKASFVNFSFPLLSSTWLFLSFRRVTAPVTMDQKGYFPMLLVLFVWKIPNRLWVFLWCEIFDVSPYVLVLEGSNWHFYWKNSYWPIQYPPTCILFESAKVYTSSCLNTSPKMEDMTFVSLQLWQWPPLLDIILWPVCLAMEALRGLWWCKYTTYLHL